MSLKDKAHHAIMLMTGARNRTCCPKCGSLDYYRNLTLDRCDEMYEDGYVVEGELEYACSDHICSDCDYCEEY